MSDLKEPAVKMTRLSDDRFSRQLWQAPAGAIFVDIDGELYTRTDYGEPAFPTGYSTPKETPDAS